MFSNGTGKSQYSTGSNSRSCCRYNYLPEYPAFTHSQSSSCIDQIHIHLLKGRPGISIHQWKRDHRSCDHTSGPCLNYLNIKIVQQKTSKRPFQAKKQKQAESSYCRRQNKRHCQNPIQHCPCSRFQFHDLPCTEYSQKKSKYSCCHTGFQRNPQRTPVYFTEKFYHIIILYSAVSSDASSVGSAVSSAAAMSSVFSSFT